MIVSIFNDVIGPVMRGPSSSHCAAPLRIGRLARDLVGGTPDGVLVEFDRAGSLPTTHDTQGSDMGLCGGLLGWDAADPRLPGSVESLALEGTSLRFDTVDVGDPHPNTYRLSVGRAGETHALRAISTGGGMIEVIDIDGWELSLHGDCHEPLLVVTGEAARRHADALKVHLESVAGVDQVEVLQNASGCLVRVRSQVMLSDSVVAPVMADVERVHRLAPILPVLTPRNVRVPFTSCAELLAEDAGRGLPLWRHAVAYEMQRGGLGEHEVIAMMTDIVRIFRRSIAEGIAGTSYDDRVLPPQAPGFARAMASGRLVGDDVLNRIVLTTTAMMEVKSSMGVIVAAPTAGACAALPAAVITLAEAMRLDEQSMARALLAAGLMGVFIATPWSFAAEVGGCQAEGGSAAAMAAAAIVTLADGSLAQSLAAASMALQSMIGLICDPVANRVEVPCLGKNVMAAANALCCANMALAGFDAVIPFDEVVATASRVAGQMPRELRCTALGGLSITPTSLALEERLARRRQEGCGAGGCGCR
ncbi:MAG: L-serine ammonia-lyase, iron-sulfur-dependent, subunit alpha [Planctomycetaceae bacterium]